MIDEIVLHTNVKLNTIRAKLQTTTNPSNYRNTENTEIKVFIGVLMMTSVFKSSHEDMFSLFEKDLTGHPIFVVTCQQSALKYF